MADWTELDTNGLLPGEPFTSAKALAFFENPVAMAEGAVDAPKVVSEALDMLVGAGTTTTSFTNLGRIDKVLLSASCVAVGGASSSTTTNVGYQTSTNNGATYGSTTNFATAFAVANTTEARAGFAVVSLGASNAIRVVVGSTGNFSILGVSGVSP